MCFYLILLCEICVPILLMLQGAMWIFNYPKIFLTLNGFLNKFYALNNQSGIKAKGFKLMHFQTYYTPGILNYIKKNNIKVIVLIRKNILLFTAPYTLPARQRIRSVITPVLGIAYNPPQ